MTATASTVRATGQYRRLQNESRAAAADPVELVTMLYDELETAVGVLAAMVRQGQRVSATEPAHRARTILIGLDVGLDRDAGGDVATALSRVYRSMRRKLDKPSRPTTRRRFPKFSKASSRSAALGGSCADFGAPELTRKNGPPWGRRAVFFIHHVLVTRPPMVGTGGRADRERTRAPFFSTC